jgi:hypothetical protein
MSARPLQTGTQTSLWVCSTDTDYFSYSVNAGDPLAFEISFLPNEGGVSALLLDSTGTQVAAATSTMRGEVSVSHTAATQGTYYLQVFLTSDAGTVIGNSYTLQSTIGRPSAGCMTDQYEPNDSRSSAQPIMVGTHPNLYSCNLDDDNYLIDLTAGSVVTISADFSHAEGDIDLRLYGPSSLSTVADSVTFSAPETISNYVVATSGTHRIKITQYLDAGSFPGNSYTLSIAVR